MVRLKRVLFLSGDVHYSYSCVAHYLDERTPNSPRSAVFGQLNSSALKNSDADTHIAANKGFFGRLLKNQEYYYIYGWEKPGKHMKSSLFNNGYVSGKPAMLMTGAKGIVAFIAGKTRKFVAKPDHPPNWRYGLSFKHDSRGNDLRSFPKGSSLNFSNTNNHSNLLADHMDWTRTERMVVGYDCVCLVLFDYISSIKRMDVTHQIWHSINGETEFSPYTVHHLDQNPPNLIGDDNIPPFKP